VAGAENSNSLAGLKVGPETVVVKGNLQRDGGNWKAERFRRRAGSKDKCRSLECTGGMRNFPEGVGGIIIRGSDSGLNYGDLLKDRASEVKKEAAEKSKRSGLVGI
jgi:hypothetical protein